MKRRTATEEIYRRTDGRCHFCGDPLAPHGHGKKGDGGWEKDHIQHKVRGGTEGGNLLPACRPCNRLRWHASGRRIREVLELGLIARQLASPSTKLGKKLLRIRNQYRRGKGIKVPKDPVADEELRRKQRLKIKNFLRRKSNLRRWFSAARLSRATGVPKGRVRSLLDTEFSINVELQNRQYLFQSRRAKRHSR